MHILYYIYYIYHIHQCKTVHNLFLTIEKNTPFGNKQLFSLQKYLKRYLFVNKFKTNW